MVTTVELLASVPLFSMLGKKELAGLAADLHDRTFPAGTVFTEEQEFGSIFTIIAEGHATVTVDAHNVLTLGPGDYFGEMALIDGAPRSATVTADTEVRGLMLTQWVFRPFAMRHPEVAWALLELMVQRVRAAEARGA
jgi:voltage-gated potassium channel